jgi:hypothetical protein
MAETGRAGEFQIVDIYRRETGRLPESWVCIEVLHFRAGQDADRRARATGGTTFPRAENPAVKKIPPREDGPVTGAGASKPAH